MAKNSITITVNLSDDSKREYYSCSKTFYVNFPECEYNNVISKLDHLQPRFVHLLKQTVTDSLDYYIMNGEDNSNDQD